MKSTPGYPFSTFFQSSLQALAIFLVCIAKERRQVSNTSIAYVLDKLKGKGGLNGWQWIFLVEGIATIFLGILTWLYIADFPDKATFLSEKERQVGGSLYHFLDCYLPSVKGGP